MKIDRHHNPYEDLENTLIVELEEQIIQQIEVLVEELGGKMNKLTRSDSTGKSSKIISIEYDIKNP